MPTENPQAMVGGSNPIPRVLDLLNFNIHLDNCKPKLSFLAMIYFNNLL